MILAYLVMGLVWPWSVLSPLNPFRAAEYFSNFFEKPWRELFDGQLIPVIDMPRSYVPTLFALQMPELMLVLGLCGTVGAIVRRRAATTQHRRRSAAAPRLLPSCSPRHCRFWSRSPRGRPCITASAISCSCCRRSPCSAALPPPGSHSVLRRYGTSAVAAGGLAFIVGIASPVVDMVRLHPYEYTDYNHLAGGVARSAARTSCSIIGACR